MEVAEEQLMPYRIAVSENLPHSHEKNVTIEEAMCRIQQFLPEVVELIEAQPEATSEEYQRLLEERICHGCPLQDGKGFCPLRARHSCCLDRYFTRVTVILHEVQQQRAEALLEESRPRRWQKGRRIVQRIGLLALVVWLVMMPARPPVVREPLLTWLEGSIHGLTWSHMPRVRLLGADGQEHFLEIDFNTTSVFQDHTIVDASYLKPGQRVRMLIATSAERVVAKSIAILQSPTAAVYCP